MSEAPLPRITADDGCGGVDEPFDWLEDEGAEAGAWLAAQAHQTTERLASLPGDQRRLAEAIRGALAYETRSVPIGCTGRYLFLNSPADAERPSLWLAGDPAAEGREILHPQRLDGEGGLAATGDLWPSPDGCHAVLAVTHGGRQRTQLVLIAIAAEGPAIVLDSLETPASAWAAWHDESSVFISRREGERQMLSLRHLSGEETALAAPCETTDAGLVPMVSDDGAWLVIVVFAPGVPGCRLFAALNAPCPTFAEILGVDDEGLGLGGWRGEGLVLVPRTTSGGREVVLADLRPLLAGGSPCLSSLYREDGDRMTAACVLRTGEIVLIDRAPDGGHAFRCLVDGRTVDVPADPGTALAAWTVAEGRLLATMSSWTAPACLVAFDAESRRFIRLRETGRRLGVDVSRAAVESDDGVRVPVTLIRSAGGGDESARPCLLWGYGGFGISLRPNCMMGLEPWFAAGGMLAIAHVRGGGEGGTAWHEAARGAAKLTSFTDFIAVARWLTASRQTTPERLCAWGSSAGGLLVLGSAVLAPDLFRAVIADNPVTDIARFTRFADDGRFWTVEFGDTARDPAALAAAARWSPLHNLQSGRDYPATLISVSRNDQRVSPIHGRKMTAALQATESRGPHLLMERDGVGHGGMATVGDAADAMATVLRFIAWATDSHLSLTCPQ